MNKILVVVAIIVSSLGISVGDAEAKRLGGGRSSGMQRDSVTQRQLAPPQGAATPATAAAASPAAAAAPKRNWMGPLAGLAAGLGIAALLGHLGMGEGMANLLLIAFLAMAAVVVFKLLFRRRSAAMARPQPLQYAGAGGAGIAGQPGPGPGVPGERQDASLPSTGASGLASVPAKSIPEGFDVEGFLRIAKLNFVRLQAANDAGNLEDIREFVSPEMFAEIKLQIDERGNAPQQTDVVTLSAELLEVVSKPERHIASVRFNGMIREEAGAPALPFDEVWNLAKSVDGHKGWVIAGIQQLS